jgi:hypothetical protein
MLRSVNIPVSRIKHTTLLTWNWHVVLYVVEKKPYGQKPSKTLERKFCDLNCLVKMPLSDNFPTILDKKLLLVIKNLVSSCL